MSEPEPRRPNERSSRWSDIAARLFIVAVLALVIWLVCIKFG